MVKSFGPDRVLMGSDYPFDMGDPEPRESVDRLEIDTEAKEMVAGGNAAKLLKIGLS